MQIVLLIKQLYENSQSRIFNNKKKTLVEKPPSSASVK